MPEAVYLLCAITSVLCAVLLLRSWTQTRTRLLFWSGLCFVGLALNNVLLFLDLVIVPELDLRYFRSGVALLSLVSFIYGLITETK
ncbi:MAG TPA: DUF5985 family protein [Nannocystaceae bacterium]|nr:DUF5985 family protein [Nannocystaceae bacterium]